MTVAVQLTVEDFDRAATVGLLRQSHAVTQGRQPTLVWWDLEGFRPRSWLHQAASHIYGAVGELVYCRAIGAEWDATVDGYRAIPDAAGGIEIRARSKPPYSLIVRQSDPWREAFVLVAGLPPAMHAVGWIDDAHARDPQWWTDPGNRGAACWCIPSSQLWPLSDLLP